MSGIAGRSLFFVDFQNQGEAIPPREKTLQRHGADTAVGIVGIDDAHFFRPEIDQRDHVRPLTGNQLAEADDGSQVLADGVTQDGGAAGTDRLRAVIDMQIVEDGFEVDLHGPRRVFFGQTVERFDAMMPSQRFQGAPSTAAFGMIPYSIFQSDFHFGMGSAPRNSKESQDKAGCSEGRQRQACNLMQEHRKSQSQIPNNSKDQSKGGM